LLGAACLLLLAAARMQPAMLRAGALDPPMTGVPTWRVDLETAPAEELQLLPGIGPKLAQRIVMDRQAHGRFGGVAGLDRVSGVGASVIERITPFVR